jgi:hypothetical protein
MSENYSGVLYATSKRQMECPVCYTNKTSCKLVCGHAFCKDCVKTWYHKCEEPSCPMCRRVMYFKGMNKVIRVWEKERIIKKNEDAFNQAFDEIFEDDDDNEIYMSGYDTQEESEPEPESEYESDSDDSDGSWETTSDNHENKFDFDPVRDYYTEFIMGEIKLLQKDYQKAMELDVDFEWYMDNFEFSGKTFIIEDDVFPHVKFLFVSKHKSMSRNKRSCKRVLNKPVMSFSVSV